MNRKMNKEEEDDKIQIELFGINVTSTSLSLSLSLSHSLSHTHTHVLHISAHLEIARVLGYICQAIGGHPVQAVDGECH